MRAANRTGEDSRFSEEERNNFARGWLQFWMCEGEERHRQHPSTQRLRLRSLKTQECFLREAERGPAAEGQGRRWWPRRWLAWTAAAIGAVAIVALFGVEWGMRQVQPMLRRKVVETLAARFHSPVELDRLSLSMSRGVMVTGGGLRILYLAGPTKPDARPNAPPMLTVESFEFSTGWRELLRPTTRVVSVKVRGLQVNVPPKEERGVATADDPKRRGEPKLGIAVDKN